MNTPANIPTNTPTSSVKPLYTELVRPIRTYDIDSAGIVSNIVYVRWLEDLRSELFESVWSLAQMEETGVVPVVAATNVIYKRSVTLLETVHSAMWATGAGRSSLTLEAEFSVDDALAVQATQTCVFVDLKERKASPIPVGVRAALERAYPEVSVDG